MNGHTNDSELINLCAFIFVVYFLKFNRLLLLLQGNLLLRNL